MGYENRATNLLDSGTHYARWLSRIPEPKTKQVAVQVGPLSEAKMYALWSREAKQTAHVALAAYINRRVLDDPTRHSFPAWKQTAKNIRAFRRLLMRACEESSQPDPISEYYGLGEMRRDPWKPERAQFQRALKRLGLHYSDVADALDRESEIIGAHAGMGVEPYTHALRCWFDDVMGIHNE